VWVLARSGSRDAEMLGHFPFDGAFLVGRKAGYDICR
jgi:hypothetical protein